LIPDQKPQIIMHLPRNQNPGVGSIEAERNARDHYGH
jgi:hypothetical protein